MTPDQVKAIQESFSKVAPISSRSRSVLWHLFWRIAPAIKPLFHGDVPNRGAS